MDKRKALGDGSGQTEPDMYFRKNRLPGSYPGSGRFYDVNTDPDYSGLGNPAICESRPIADMTANVGSGCIKKGTAFCVPMGEPRYGEPDYD